MQQGIEEISRAEPIKNSLDVGIALIEGNIQALQTNINFANKHEETIQLLVEETRIPAAINTQINSDAFAPEGENSFIKLQEQLPKDKQGQAVSGKFMEKIIDSPERSYSQPITINLDNQDSIKISPEEISLRNHLVEDIKNSPLSEIVNQLKEKIPEIHDELLVVNSNRYEIYQTNLGESLKFAGENVKEAASRLSSGYATYPKKSKFRDSLKDLPHLEISGENLNLTLNDFLINAKSQMGKLKLKFAKDLDLEGLALVNTKDIWFNEKKSPALARDFIPNIDSHSTKGLIRGTAVDFNSYSHNKDLLRTKSYSPTSAQEIDLSSAISTSKLRFQQANQAPVRKQNLDSELQTIEVQAGELFGGISQEQIKKHKTSLRPFTVKPKINKIMQYQLINQITQQHFGNVFVSETQPAQVQFQREEFSFDPKELPELDDIGFEFDKSEFENLFTNMGEK